MDKDNNSKTNHEKLMTTMYTEFKNLIEEYNLVNMNESVPTRNDTILDVIYCNNPKKVINCKVFNKKEGSDHYPTILTRTVKNMIESQMYKQYRDYTKYDHYIVEDNLIKDKRHDTILNTIDSSLAMSLLIEMINDAIKDVAPIRKIVIKKTTKYKNNLSKETIEHIKTVDLQKVIVSIDRNNKIEKDILRKLTKRLVKMKDYDRFKNKNYYLKNQKKENGLWKSLKNNYNNKNEIPVMLI